MELEAYGHSKISIHALREEGDQRWQCVSVDGLGFLSTPSARRATVAQRQIRPMVLYFYPRPPRGGRPGNTQAQTRRSTFLSTPSARRATTSATAISRKQRNFYPRPPRGGRQKHRDKRRGVQHFYPRPPRGGRPVPPRPACESARYFYPRPPRGGRPHFPVCLTVKHNFYPRPPRGGRPGQLALRRQLYNFYPRPPRGGRPLPFRAYVMIWQISIHALREEGDSSFTGCPWC